MCHIVSQMTKKIPIPPQTKNPPPKEPPGRPRERSGKKRLRRMSVLVTPQTAYNLQRLADMDKTSPGRVVDKLVRDRMIELRRYRDV